MPNQVSREDRYFDGYRRRSLLSQPRRLTLPCSGQAAWSSRQCVPLGTPHDHDDRRRVSGPRIAAAMQDFSVEAGRPQELDERCLRQRTPNSAEPIVQGVALGKRHIVREHDFGGNEGPAWLQHPECLGDGLLFFWSEVEDAVSHHDVGDRIGEG
jgi:hypothetical protein